MWLTALVLAGAIVPPPTATPPEREHPPVVRPVVLQRTAAEKPASPGAPQAPLFGAVPLVTFLTPADAARLFQERGGTVEEVKDTAEGFLVHATVPQQTFVTLQGLDCRGQGASKKCAMYVFEAAFRMENDARAAQLERDLSLNYVADRATGSVYSIWRMGTVSDGVTEAQVRGDLDRFMQVIWATSAKAWPNTAPANGSGGARPAPATPDATVRPASGAARVNDGRLMRASAPR